MALEKSQREAFTIGSSIESSNEADLNKKRNRRSNKKSSEEELTTITFKIPVSLRRKIKLYALNHDTTIADVMNTMIVDYLESNK